MTWSVYVLSGFMKDTSSGWSRYVADMWWLHDWFWPARRVWGSWCVCCPHLGWARQDDRRLGLCVLRSDGTIPQIYHSASCLTCESSDRAPPSYARVEKWSIVEQTLRQSTAPPWFSFSFQLKWDSRFVASPSGPSSCLASFAQLTHQSETPWAAVAAR